MFELEESVPQFPTLREAEPRHFRRYLAMSTPPPDDALLSRAEHLVTYARAGKGMTEDEAAATADEITRLLGLPGGALREGSGPGVIILGATARVALRRDQSVTVHQLRALATAGSRPRDALQVADERAISAKDAREYLLRHGVSA